MIDLFELELEASRPPCSSPSRRSTSCRKREVELCIGALGTFRTGTSLDDVPSPMGALGTKAPSTPGWGLFFVRKSLANDYLGRMFEFCIPTGRIE